MSSNHIINPRTSRPVKVGSRTWVKLVNDGIIENTEEPSGYSVKPDDDPEEKIMELNESLPINQQAVRGRGRYKGLLVKRRRQPSTHTVASHTIKTTAKTLREERV